MVEQGTENPRVGGSTPSLATFLLLLGAPLVAACGADDSERLCTRTAARLGDCLATWPAGWDDLDAESEASFEAACRQGWDDQRVELEPRELEDALDQCAEALDHLASIRQDGTVCDELRALYLDGG